MKIKLIQKTEEQKTFGTETRATDDEIKKSGPVSFKGTRCSIDVLDDRMHERFPSPSRCRVNGTPECSSLRHTIPNLCT